MNEGSKEDDQNNKGKTKNNQSFFENMKRFYKNKGNKKLLEKITIKANDFTYHAVEIIGNGSFGIVFKAIVDGTNKNVAIKKVLQDRRFKNRELQIMKTLEHRNIISLENSFFTTGGDKHNDDLYLNLVMEYIPETLYRLIRYFHKNNLEIPSIYIKVYMYQLFRGLAYIHSIGICHRDIKPQNLLIDPKSSIVKICDFGSAKNLLPDKPSVAYICSRYYRAPELIFGATFYTNAIDLWSMGCVMAELFLGEPLFPGESAIDQLVEIIKVLGTPTEEQIYSMNENYTEFNFPQIKPNSWEKVLESTSINPLAIDLISKILVYSPVERYDAFTSLSHPYFDELRQPDCKLPDQQNLPELFDFSIHEVKSMGAQLAKKIIPGWAQNKLGFKIDECF